MTFRIVHWLVLLLLAAACPAATRSDAELEFEIAARRGLDTAQPLRWNYSIDAVPSERLRPLLDALRQHGLIELEVPEQDAENDAGTNSVWTSETRVHSVDSYAKRLQTLAAMARQQRAVFEYWSVQAADGA